MVHGPFPIRVARSVACLSECLCVLGLPVSPAKTGEPIEIPFGDRLLWAYETMH